MKRFASSFFAACLSLGIGVPAITASANAAQPTALIAPPSAMVHRHRSKMFNITTIVETDVAGVTIIHDIAMAIGTTGRTTGTGATTTLSSSPTALSPCPDISRRWQCACTLVL
ncbi:hypothetical protein HGG75_00535 [Ochrobactrum pseudogrignonense]|nr:hypothetical protein [Brucella pseudogrignonensis]